MARPSMKYVRHEDLKFYVYKHTVIANGKSYIGITSQLPKHRWGSDGRKYKNCPYFFKAIKKYGWENIKHEILFEGLNKEEAENKEVELISKFRSIEDKFGYNVLVGGKLGTVGVSVTEETRRKISEASKRQYHQPMPESVKKSISESRWKTKKKIIQLNLNNSFVKEWEGGIDIERSGISLNSNIIACCRHKHHTSNGYKWIYKKEYEEMLANGTI